MAPSTLSARPGSPRGYRSASIDLRNAIGASGNWPSTAWLPITTISRSPAMRPAARIKCSSSERFIHAPPLAGREHARKGRGLTQARGRFARIGDQRGDFRPGTSEDLAPLAKRARRAVGVSRAPSGEVAPRRVEQPAIGFDFAGDQAMHREAARLDDAVLQLTGGEHRGCRGLPARGGAQARRPLAGAVAAHALGRGLGPPGRGPTRAASGFLHLFIVTCYDNILQASFLPSASRLGAGQVLAANVKNVSFFLASVLLVIRCTEAWCGNWGSGPATDRRRT